MCASTSQINHGLLELLKYFSLVEFCSAPEHIKSGIKGNTGAKECKILHTIVFLLRLKTSLWHKNSFRLDTNIAFMWVCVCLFSHKFPIWQCWVMTSTWHWEVGQQLTEGWKEDLRTSPTLLSGKFYWITTGTLPLCYKTWQQEINDYRSHSEQIIPFDSYIQDQTLVTIH